MNKIKSREELKQLVLELRSKGKIIVTVNGSFDLFHVRHVKLLQKSKEKGDILVVGVNSDKSVREWKKKIDYKDFEKRPIIPEEQRALIVSSLECVDYVTIFDEPDCLKFIESVAPDVHVNGADYGEDCIEAGLVKKMGAELCIISLDDPVSTSGIIEKVVELYK